ncbi:uncharacterized protein LOC117505798 [Thalassophryne amazonica]|uniref:uncharacterized protein LOC117505798 n=1 Tax=Thalassophryne amazonica TaxID=390379 RepID=UPI00147135AC|nr:uncharacterized protein LOC117505798 [Thalassophryne amazonica]
MHKSSSCPPAGSLVPLPVPKQPWTHIMMDFVTAPPLRGNTVIPTVVDRLSKMCHFVPLPRLPSPKEIAEIMLTHVFRLHAFPQDTVSDRGLQFVSGFWREFCHLLWATSSLTSGYHPQANVFGHPPSLFSSSTLRSPAPSALILVVRCQRTWERACRALYCSLAQHKAAMDRKQSTAPVYMTGQKVWLSPQHLPQRGVPRKLATRFLGPFPVSKVINVVSVRLHLPSSMRFHPTFHVSHAKPFRSTHLPTSAD